MSDEKPRLLGVAAFTYGVLSVPDPGPRDGMVDVPVLLLDGNVIWQADPGTYWDRWGDGGPQALEVIADALARILRQP